MENKINLDIMLSLKEISMRRVAISLWNHPDILVSVENFFKVTPDTCNYSEEWRKTVEKEVIDKLSKLVIPVSLLKQLLLIITPIGLQILEWKEFHELYLQVHVSENGSLECITSESVDYSIDLLEQLGVPVLEKLHWTAAGRIDYLHTAKELLRCNVLNVVQRYKLACLYCLEDSILLLWEKLPDEFKRKFYNRRKISLQQSLDLPFCWAYILKGEQPKLNRLIQRRTRLKRPFNLVALINLASIGNKVATEFFFHRLSNEERDVSSFTKEAITSLSFRSETRGFLLEFPQVNSGYVLYYLLSLMNYEQRMEIIQSYPIEVLNCFLDWPWQNIFLKILDLIWGFLSPVKYTSLLVSLSDFFRHSNYSYPKFFQEYFTRSPIDFKKRFVYYECCLGKFFSVFFDIQDSEAIKVVLRNTDAAGRVRLMSSEHTLKLFYNCIFEGRLHMVEMCLREARLSKEDRTRLKERFRWFFGRHDREQIQKNEQVLMRFLQILDGIDEISQSKRSSEEENQNKAKKLCSNE